MSADEADATNDTDDLAAATGYHTLAAQASREAINRVVATIRRELLRGVGESKLALLLERHLPDYDAHSRKLLLQLGSDQQPPDDFPAEIVESSHRTKPNTLEMTLKAVPKDLNLFSLVQHQGQQWMVVACTGKQCSLKSL